MTEIYLARHPETILNADRSLVGGRSNDAPLTERGVEQARRFATVFSQDFPTPDVVYSSPALRAKYLAGAYLQESQLPIPLRVDDALQEMSQGTAEGKSRFEIYTPEIVAQIETELFDFRLPEGESLNDVSERMLDWVWRVHKEFPEGTVLATGHGQAIRRTVGALLNWSHYENTLSPDTVTPNVSLTHLSVDTDGITVHYMGKEIIEPVLEP